MSTPELDVLIVVGFLLVFGCLGFWRGWLRETTGLGVIAVTWLVLQVTGRTLAELANKAYVILAFTLQGGFDSSNPSQALRSARLAAPIDAARPESFYSLLLIVAATVVFLVVNQKVAGPRRWIDQILGGLAGLVNGYALLYLESGLLAENARLAPPIVTSLREVERTLENYLAFVFIGAITVLILAALVGSLRTPFQGKRARST